jgi:hypothetical protein
MHMTVFPIHGHLQGIMQLLQRQVCGNQQSAADRRISTEESDFDLTDFLRLLDRVGWQIRPSVILRCAEPMCG